MDIRPFERGDAAALARLSAHSARGETDFVLNPFWETEDELFAEFERFGIAPEEHLLVADAGDGEVLGLAGFLRRPRSELAALCCPIVQRTERGRGVGGQLLRAARDLGRGRLAIRLATAAIGTRNRAGYSLLTSHGFRPVRHHFLMQCTQRPKATLPEGFDLEAAGPGDAEAILPLYTECGFEPRSPEEMARVLADGRHAHGVARHDGRVVGFVELETHWPTRVWVSFVGVEPGLRDRGLGTALVAWSLERRFEARPGTALLLLSPANRTAYRAYEKVGFRRHRLVDVLEKML